MTQGHDTICRRLATHIAETGYDDLPEEPLKHAAMLIASTLASAAAGRDIESAMAIRGLETARGGAPEATVWYSKGAKLPVVGAARTNALMSDAAASDDSDLRNITHAGTPLTASTLAIAERGGNSGKEVLAAIVLGYEAAGRIGASVTPGFRERGFHACIIAIFSAAAATAKLLGGDAARISHALAIATSSIGGLISAATASVLREYHGGLATMLGMEAAMAAHAGFTGEERVFEMPKGFCETYGGAARDRQDAAGTIAAAWGADWDIVTDMAIKLAPGSHFNQTMAEAAANAARQGDIKPGQVTRIILNRPGMTEFRGPIHPKDLTGMAHSVTYFLAAGVADRCFTWMHASPEKIADPVINALIDTCEMGPEPTANLERYRQGATVTIETTDGRRVTDTVYVPNGAGCRGIDWADVEAKYRALTPAALGEKAIEESLAALRDFAELTDVSALTKRLD